MFFGPSIKLCCSPCHHQFTFVAPLFATLATVATNQGGQGVGYRTGKTEYRICTSTCPFVLLVGSATSGDASLEGMKDALGECWNMRMLVARFAIIHSRWGRKASSSLPPSLSYARNLWRLTAFSPTLDRCAPLGRLSCSAFLFRTAQMRRFRI